MKTDARAEAAAALKEARRERRSASVVPKPPQPEIEEAEDWVISYMDMVTLLMIVFLGMLAILMIERRFDAHELKLPPDAVAGVNPGKTDVPYIFRPEVEPAPPPPPTEPPLSPDARMLLDRLVKAGLPPDVKFDVRDRQIVIELPDRLLFPSGQADLVKSGDAVLRQLAPLLTVLGGVISVEGHTDDVPIATARFPSNWELSAARASSVTRRLVELGIVPSRVRAIGYADTRPIAVAPAGRALNRRVTLVIEP